MKLLRPLAFIPVVLVTLPFAQPATAKCAVRSITRADGTLGSILAVVPDRGSKDIEDAGYQDASCGDLDKAAYREKVCNPKSLGNSGVQRQLEIQSGLSFVKLCSAARAEAGLPDTASIQGKHGFSPVNRRPPVSPQGPSLLETMGKQNSTSGQIEGN